MYLNPYAIPGIISFIINICIGSYVFYKNPKKIQNRVFVLLIFAMTIFSLGEAMLRLSSSSNEALLWGRVCYFGVIFMPMASLHLSFVFPNDKMTISFNKYIISGFYITSIIVLFFFNLNASIQDLEQSQWGYRLALSSKFTFVGIYILIVGSLAIINFLRSYMFAKTIVERKQIKQIVYGGIFILLFTGGTNIILPLFEIEVFPMGIISLTIFAIFVASAVQRYNLFRFKPMVEPAFEKRKFEPKLYQLQSGKCYTLYEDHGKQAYEIFVDQITSGISGLCITKYPPKTIRDRHGFKKTPILWLTFNQPENEKIINPKKIDIELIPQIEAFVKKGKQSIVLLDCLDQIMVTNGFTYAIDRLKEVKELCNTNKSILLLTYDPKMFGKEQIAALEEGAEKLG